MFTHHLKIVVVDSEMLSGVSGMEDPWKSRTRSLQFRLRDSFRIAVDRHRRLLMFSTDGYFSSTPHRWFHRVHDFRRDSLSSSSVSIASELARTLVQKKIQCLCACFKHLLFRLLEMLVVYLCMALIVSKYMVQKSCMTYCCVDQRLSL